VDSCVPGAPQPEVCNTIDDDCNGALPASEADPDRDTWSACEGDCDDGYYYTFPGAAERNDARDNQCVGDPGDGLVDELTGIVGFTNLSDPSRICWPAQTPAWAYEVARSSAATFPGGCERSRVETTCLVDPELPPSRSAFYYLVRPIAPHAGSFGSRSSGAEWQAVCGFESDCDDNLDNDADGATDCSDPACLGQDGCRSVGLSFTDTLGDDIAATNLEAFFRKIPAVAGDHLSVYIKDGGLPSFRWCSERADFYRERYLELAPSSGIAMSGPWNRWYEENPGVEPAWVGPLTGAHENWYGDDCAGPYSWCSEVGLGGRIPGIAPAETSVCEVFEDIACGDGTSSILIMVGEDRLWGCGL